MTEPRDTSAERAEPALATVAPWRWWTGFAVVSAIALSLTLLAYREGLPQSFVAGHRDKLWHFGIGGLLAFFLDGALERRAVALGPVRLPLAAALVLVPAGVEEFLQRYATFRTSSFWDFAADVTGVIAFTWLSRRAAR